MHTWPGGAAIILEWTRIGRVLLLSALVASCAMPGPTPEAHPSTQPPSATQQPTATVVVAPAPTATPPALSATHLPGPTSRPSTAPPPSARPGVVDTGTPVVLPGTAQLSAPGRGVLWALMNGQSLFRSLDGGTTWEQRGVPSGDQLPAVKESSFVSEREGWLLSPGSPATQCQAQAISLWHTTDAGTTWQPSTPAGVEPRQCKDALTFVDALQGFLAAGDPNHPPILYRTTDGGRTWAASAPLPDPPGFTTRGAGFTLRAERVRAFGSTLLVPVRAPSGLYVYRSTDGGATWAYAATPPPEEAGLGFVTVTRWIALSAPDQSLETTDGGASWHAYATDYTQAAPIAPEVVFADDQVGYATVRGLIQRTADGGAHWSRIPSPGSAETPLHGRT
jgi:photosystem II stability/assembly factor-like uncharacterized protein